MKRYFGLIVMVFSTAIVGLASSARADDGIALNTYPACANDLAAGSGHNIATVGYQTGGCCEGGCTDLGCRDCDCGAFYVQYDSVIVKPLLSRNSAYTAQIADSLNANVAFDLDLEYSPRVEAGYVAPTSQLGWRARYWHFETDSTAGPANDANGLIADDAIAISVGATVEDIDSLTAVFYDLELDVVDYEVTRACGDGMLGIGVRYADFEQRYVLDDSDEGTLASDVDSWGIGPTMSLQFARTSRNYCDLAWFASVRGSLLFGDRELQSVTSDYNNVFYDEMSMMTNAEVQLGMELRRNNWSLRTALETQYWGNVGNATNAYSGTDDSPDEFSNLPIHEDIGFVGLNVSLNKRF